MIFITVGTHDQGFERLISAMDKLAGKRKIKERVVMQIGSSKYIPKNAEWFRYIGYKRMEELNKKAKIIVTHGGAGSILTALSLDKPTIAVPRLKKMGEAINNHQLDLVKKLEKKGKIIAVYDIKNLNNTILKVKTLKKTKKGNRTTKNMICDEIRIYLNKWYKKSK